MFWLIFQPETMEKLVLGDKILVKAFGVGLKLLDFPDVKVMNMDPGLLKTLKPNAKVTSWRFLLRIWFLPPLWVRVWVQTKFSGDYDIQLFDEKVIEQYGLEDLRLGDLVAIIDADHSFGRIYRQGAITVGIVVHTNCVTAGHGPGVTTSFHLTSGKNYTADRF